MGGKSQSLDRDRWLDSLAHFLIARHISVSIPDHAMRHDLLAEEESAIWEQCRHKFRCIAVIGAGASAPVLDRGDDLANGLIEKFNIGQAAVEAERERLGRITAVDPTEFEAQLSAIGQTLGNSRRVRAAISDLYNVRHPTILAYELLAHLLKHRFVDAIISMNFDELLDQSLDDELGIGEYERIVSDRDCVNTQSDVFAPDYLPLYIKLHGTASEPESLRFTRESYYDSPVQVGTEAARLFQVPECIVLNIGFGMASFDLHRLLAIPDRLWLYNLSHDPLTPKARSAIKRERERQGKEAKTSHFKESSENRKRYKLELKRERAGKQGSLEGDTQTTECLEEEASEASNRAMDTLMREITGRVRELSPKGTSAIGLRSVRRHRTVDKLLGPKSDPGKRLINLPRSSEDPRLSLDPMSRAARPESVTAGYLLRRTILELAMAMARGRGLVSIATLAVDRCGLYYDAYCRHAGKNPYSWRDLYTLVGFEQNEEVPDVLRTARDIHRDPLGPSNELLLRGQLLSSPGPGDKDKWHELPELDPHALAKRVLPHIVDAPSPKQERLLAKELKQLYEGTEYEIHSRDDRVCDKTFSEPSTLRTLSSLDAYSFELVKCTSENGGSITVDIISETGDWLLRRSETFIEHLSNAAQIRLIVAFLCDVPKLRQRFPDIELRFLQPWHHNRHMVIVRANSEPLQGIYFARHHRTPYVTPVLVHRRQDIRILQTTFEDRWENAEPVQVQ